MKVTKGQAKPWTVFASQSKTRQIQHVFVPSILNLGTRVDQLKMESRTQSRSPRFPNPDHGAASHYLELDGLPSPVQSRRGSLALRYLASTKPVDTIPTSKGRLSSWLLSVLGLGSRRQVLLLDCRQDRRHVSPEWLEGSKRHLYGGQRGAAKRSARGHGPTWPVGTAWKPEEGEEEEEKAKASHRTKLAALPDSRWSPLTRSSAPSVNGAGSTGTKRVIERRLRRTPTPWWYCEVGRYLKLQASSASLWAAVASGFVINLWKDPRRMLDPSPGQG